ncbi:glycosyltransferase family 2 protein [Planctomicrobium piriforme]|uniref:Glycosyltransferase involved in cell wall bisynthesis n=1 Tax=Planctomicrobium piriforme TaxID=1576369 RepID=A0A1I3B8M7_9PLAN|nr:glycosyltransferase family 2 protein [Planctomicrobium piriforme]SFH58624.1 Glycosyltransferase involved in cell wall bisynthesis [Planctomicrobium piriforme]
MPRVSAFVTTFNDEETIGACLDSLKWADEIVLLDSFSTDRTIEIARQYTDCIYQHKFLGYGRQKQSALDKCTCDWVLFLDSDEMLPLPLQAEIQLVMRSEPSVDGYEIPRREQLFWRMASPNTRHNHFLRLFRRSKVKFNTIPVHAGPELDGRSAKLREQFFHFGERSIHEKVEKVNGYSTGLVNFRAGQGRTASPWAMLYYPPFTFLRQYIQKRHYLNGWAGFIASVCMAFYSFMKCAKAYESVCRERYGSTLLPDECPRLEAPQTAEPAQVTSAA